MALKDAYPQGVTDALPIVQKVRNSKAEAVFPVSYFTDAVLIIRSMRQAGLNIPVIGGAAGYVIPEFSKALGKFADGILSIDTSCYDHYGEIGKLYREKHGQFMTHEAYEHAVLVYALVEAINKAGSADPAKIAQGLREIKMTGGPSRASPERRSPSTAPASIPTPIPLWCSGKTERWSPSGQSRTRRPNSSGRSNFSAPPRSSSLRGGPGQEVLP